MGPDLRQLTEHIISLVKAEAGPPWKDPDDQINLNFDILVRELHHQGDDLRRQDKQSYGEIIPGDRKAQAALAEVSSLRMAIAQQEKRSALTALGRILWALETPPQRIERLGSQLDAAWTAATALPVDWQELHAANAAIAKAISEGATFKQPKVLELSIVRPNLNPEQVEIYREFLERYDSWNSDVERAKSIF